MNLWIAIYHHRHGEDVIPVYGSEPSVDEIIEGLDDFEDDGNEWVEVRGPWTPENIPVFEEVAA